MNTSDMNMNGLNAVLFEMIDRVNDDDLTGQELEEQLKKAKTVAALSGAIAKNVDLSLKAACIADRSRGTVSLGSTGKLLGIEQKPVPKKDEEDEEDY